MINKKVVIIALVTVSALLNGMKVFDKKNPKVKSLTSSQEITVSAEENNGSLARTSSVSSSKKQTVTSVKDIKELKRVQGQLRDQAASSRSESSLDKK